MNDKQREKAKALIRAAEEYWAVCGGKWGAAVRWLQDDQGRVIIFTRGEYTETLMANIEAIEPTEFFEIS